jgi:hypothetical protein
MCYGDEFEIIWMEAVVTSSWYYPSICLKELRKTTKISVRITSVPIEIRTENFQSTSVKHHPYAYMFDGGLMNNKSERKRLWPILQYSPDILLGRVEKNHEKPESG